MRKVQKSLILLIMIFILFGCLLTGCGNTSSNMTADEKIAFIQNGTFGNYPNVPIISACNGFFDDCDWSSEDNGDIVQMEGDAYFNGEDSTFLLTFTIDGDDSFSLSNVTVTGSNTGKVSELSKNDISEMVDAIFTNGSNVNSNNSSSDNTSNNDSNTSSVNSTTTNNTNTNDRKNNRLTSNSDCSICGGDGYCTHCVTGDCEYCFGEGWSDCERCWNGNCIECSGDGGRYVYAGGGSEWKLCSVCNTTGRCNSCDGFGEKKCGICRGSGDCTYCYGSGYCSSCNGTGKR